MLVRPNLIYVQFQLTLNRCLYVYKNTHMYVCIVMIVDCSALLTAKGWFGKLTLISYASLHIVLQHIIMTRLLDCEIETEMVVGRFEVEP